MYLIWQRYSTAKGAKMNTSQNVIHLQYARGFVHLVMHTVKPFGSKVNGVHLVSVGTKQ